MWNPFRKPQMNQQEMMNKMMESLMAKQEVEELPYRSTRIGFGSTLSSDIKA